MAGGRGGARPGAGRKPVLAPWLTGNLSPLETLEAIMRHPSVPLKLRLAAAKTAAPYRHARLAPAAPEPVDRAKEADDTAEKAWAALLH